ACSRCARDARCPGSRDHREALDHRNPRESSRARRYSWPRASIQLLSRAYMTPSQVVGGSPARTAVDFLESLVRMGARRRETCEDKRWGMYGRRVKESIGHDEICDSFMRQFRDCHRPTIAGGGGAGTREKSKPSCTTTRSTRLRGVAEVELEEATESL